MEIYKSELEEKSKEIESKTNLMKTSFWDISCIEQEVFLAMRDMRFKNEYPENTIDFLKELFFSYDLGLFVYNSHTFEYYPAKSFRDVIYIGVPLSLVYENRYVPLIGRELGHHFYDGNVFKQFDKVMDSKIADIENDAYRPATINHLDKTLSAKAIFLKRILPEWKKEFYSDLFGCAIFGLKYVHSFAIFQINKGYYNTYEDDPTNKLRFEVMLTFLEMDNVNKQEIDEIRRIYNGLISSDADLETKTRGIFNEDIIVTLARDFQSYMSSNECIRKIKNAFEKWDSLD